jgi:hypothetical protein
MTVDLKMKLLLQDRAYWVAVLTNAYAASISDREYAEQQLARCEERIVEHETAASRALQLSMTAPAVK